MWYFFIVISVLDTHITSIGPFVHYHDCDNMLEEVEEEIKSSFNNTFMYGMHFDQWEINSIVRHKDYALECVRKK